MKKLKLSVILLLVLVLCTDCKSNKIVPELPSPTPPAVINPGDGDGGDNTGGKEDEGETETGPWDANRGKVVTPTGSGWSSSTVVEGIKYWTFSGTEPVSNAKQKVFVIDWDTNVEGYRIGLQYTSGGIINSDVFKAQNAIASLNGGYEQASIVIKIAGKLYSAMPNNNIGTTDVPNWKNDGAVYWDSEGVRIRHDGKGKTIAQQRNFYVSSKEANILTSAPMLVSDYKPVGETFVNYTGNLNNLNYENPNRHQGVRHPRTAIATTENGHVLLIAIDGRRTSSAGMTAKELTQFLVNNFNVQYALNLDGGGSTTMCVQGRGDSVTHVVNSPTDEEGERTVTTHFYIVEN